MVIKMFFHEALFIPWHQERPVWTRFRRALSVSHRFGDFLIETINDYLLLRIKMESEKFKKSMSWLGFAEKFRILFMAETSKVNHHTTKK